MFAVVLVQPEIPPNTGNVIRLTANTATELHLVEPLGFRMDDRELKRAGLDYHEYARVQVHRDWDRCRAALDAAAPRRYFALTTGAHRSLYDAAFLPGDVLVFGRESSGLPPAVLAGFAPDAATRDPDAARRAQPQPVERGGGHRLRSVAPAGIRAAPARATPHSSSARGSRRSSASTACRGDSPSCSTRSTASQIGMSMPWCAARRRAARAASTPSATCPSSARMSGQRAALRERQAHAPVARQVARTREHEVAQSREAHQRGALPAHRRGQAPGLGEAARDQRGARVVPEAQAVARAGGDREHVLDGAADFHARDVVRLVGAQRVAAQQVRDAARERRDRWPPRRAPWAGRAPLRRRSSARTRVPPARGHRGPITWWASAAPPGAPGARDESLRQPEQRHPRAEIAQPLREFGKRRDRAWRRTANRPWPRRPRIGRAGRPSSGNAMPGR